MKTIALVVLIAVGVGLSAIEWWVISTTGQSTNVIGGIGVLIVLGSAVALWRRRKATKRRHPPGYPSA